MKTRVKIFDNEMPDKLEKDINEFLNEKLLIDIKYTSSRSSKDYGEEILFSALVIYEEEAE